MPNRLVWRKDADDHLDAIFDYISVHSPRAAKAYIEDIIDACQRLRSFPDSGRRYDGRYRILVVRNHLVFYRHDIEDRSVVIAAVIDGRRDVIAALDDLPGFKN